MRDEIQIVQENTEDELEKWQGSMLDYLDNYTVDHNQIRIVEDNKIHNGKWIEDDKSYPIKPIESYVQFHNQQSKCFSYFTLLQKHWRNFQTSLTMLILTIDYGVPYRSIALNDHLYIAFHSPNILPDLTVPGEHFIGVWLGYDYDIGLSYIRIEHLEKYDSGCINYDLENKHANNNIRTDCLLNCMRNMTKCNKGSEPPDSLLRREYFEMNLGQKPELCKIKRSTLNKYHQQCQMKCPIQCSFTYYNLDMDERNENRKVENYTKTTIRLNHNLLPDHIIKHVPEITFTTLICNFAGIISLWLGFNIMSVTQDIIGFTTKFIMSKCTFIINMNQIIALNNEQKFFSSTETSSPFYRKYHRSNPIDNLDVLSLK